MNNVRPWGFGFAGIRRSQGSEERGLGGGRGTRIFVQTSKVPMNSEATSVEEAAQRRRFVQARAARSASLLEDYAELIADLSRKNGEARIVDIARALGVTSATAAKAIDRLKRAGLAVSRPYRGVFLTEAGSSLAKRLGDRRRLVVDVLMALGAPKEAAEAMRKGSNTMCPARL